ncbi:MAG: PAS domain-containing sensor histidine kinase, partial [Acidobacteriota bacterium]
GRSLDAFAGLVAEFDGDLRIVRVNRAMAERLGCAPGDCRGRDLLEVIRGQRRPPGSSADDVSGSGAASGGAAPSGANEAVRAGEQRLLVALESAGVGIFDWDVSTGKVIYVDPYPSCDSGEVHYREADIAADWLETTHPDDLPVAQAAVERVVTGETDRFLHLVRRRPKGPRTDAWLSLLSRGRAVARDDQGRATRIVGTFEDVTEAVRREQAERDRENAFVQATRAASLGVLVSSLAHEVNQPLAALSGYVQAAARLLAEKPERRAEAEEALGRSVELAERASEIVRRLRRLLRGSPPVRERIEVEPLLGQVKAGLERQAQAARVEVTVQVASPLPALVGDRVQIEQVVLNLALNAIEAIAAAACTTRKVTLSAARVGTGVEIAVADSGPGIGTEAEAHVFEPFFTTKDSGMGLGLAISESLAEAHGGRIRLDRTGPQGATFVLLLPLPGEDERGAG